MPHTVGIGSFNGNTVQLFKVAGTFHVPQPQEKQRFSQLAGRHTECACDFLNGIAFNRVPREQWPAGWIPTRGALPTRLNECAVLSAQTSYSTTISASFWRLDQHRKSSSSRVDVGREFTLIGAVQ